MLFDSHKDSYCLYRQGLSIIQTCLHNTLGMKHGKSDHLEKRLLLIHQEKLDTELYYLLITDN